MRIKKIYAKDARAAMRKLKSECGDDAVILSNRTTIDGVELIVGVDYDHEVIGSLEQKVSSSRETAQTYSPASVVNAASQSSRSINKPADLFQQNLQQAAVKAEQQAVVEAKPQVATNNAIAKSAVTPTAKATPQTQAALRDALAELIVMAAPKAAASKPARKAPSKKATVGNKVPNKVSQQTAKKRQALSKADVVSLQKPILRSIRRELNSLGSMMQDQMEFMGWGRWSSENPKHANLLRQLTAIGLGTGFCKKIIKNIRGEADSDKAWQRALGIWAHHLNIGDDTILTKGGVVALIGPTGVGKTTTIAKLAAKFAAKHGKKSVLIISNDNERLGAHEQLQSLGHSLGVTVMSALTNQELHDILATVRRSKKLILIDRSGINASDSQKKIQRQLLVDQRLKIQRVLVLSSSAQIGSLEQTVNRYKKLAIKGCILTKLDEAASLGGVLTVVAHHGLPITYITNGPQVSSDIQPAKVPYLLSKAVALSNIKQAKPDEVTMAMRFGASITKEAV